MPIPLGHTGTDNWALSQSGTEGTQNTVSEEFFECANGYLENTEAQYSYSSKTGGKTVQQAGRPLAELDIEDGDRMEDSEDAHLPSRPSLTHPAAEATRHHQIRSKSRQERRGPPIRSSGRSPPIEVGGQEQAAWSREMYLNGFLNREKEQGIIGENDFG